MAETSIEWTRNPDGSPGKVWNCLRGCSLKSKGCQNCYAMRMAHRFSGPGQPYEGLTRLGAKGPIWTGEVRTVPEKLGDPLRWRKPSTIFVNSMSDLFHEDVPDEFILSVFDVMRQCTWAGGQGCGRIGGSGHTFQILTKRADRMQSFVSRLRWQPGAESLTLDGPLPNDACHPMRTGMGDQIWLGVSVEDQVRADERIPHLLRTPAAVRFLSMEPLLGEVDLSAWFWPYGRTGDAHVHDSLTDLPGEGIRWVIGGGESGPGARPMHPDWVRSLRDDCQAAGVPYFFKQWGGFKPVGSLDDMDDSPGAMDADESKTICLYPDGEQDPDGEPGRGGYFMEPVGKKAAGRLLDGRTWDQFPEVAHAR